jgi:LPS-assembly lipoprotein
MRLLTALGIFLCLINVAGCGFHLRSWNLQNSVESVYIAGGTRSSIADALKQALRQADVKEADSAGEAQYVIEVQNERRDRRSASVTGNTRVAEYELQHEVLYSIRDSTGKLLSPSQWISTERVYQVDRENIVGSSEEQTLVEKEMRDDLVQQIFRALNTISEPAGAS